MSLLDRDRPVSDQCEEIAGLIKDAYRDVDYADPDAAPAALGRVSAYGTFIARLVPRIRDMERRLARRIEEAEDDR